jgi:hypothetical protein
VTEAEFERSKDDKKNLRLEKQVVTEDGTESELMRRWNTLKSAG